MLALDADRLPWERQIDEPGHWFQRFDKYAKPLGAEFTPRRAYFLYRAEFAGDQAVAGENALPLWELSAGEWLWLKRAKEFASFESFQLQQQWNKRRMHLLEEDYKMSNALRTYAKSSLEQLQLFTKVKSVTDPITGTITIVKRINFRPAELAQMAKIGSELGRLSVDLPTQITENTGPEVGIYLPSIAPDANLPEPPKSNEA